MSQLPSSQETMTTTDIQNLLDTNAKLIVEIFKEKAATGAAKDKLDELNMNLARLGGVLDDQKIVQFKKDPIFKDIVQEADVRCKDIPKEKWWFGLVEATYSLVKHTEVEKWLKCFQMVMLYYNHYNQFIPGTIINLFDSCQRPPLVTKNSCAFARQLCGLLIGAMNQPQVQSINLEPYFGWIREMQSVYDANPEQLNQQALVTGQQQEKQQMEMAARAQQISMQQQVQQQQVHQQQVQQQQVHQIQQQQLAQQPTMEQQQMHHHQQMQQQHHHQHHHQQQQLQQQHYAGEIELEEQHQAVQPQQAQDVQPGHVQQHEQQQQQQQPLEPLESLELEPLVMSQEEPQMNSNEQQPMPAESDMEVSM
eukprot:TRINITY_DN517_c0_g2_i2.p1 TRINITY_DN517_c0_g2~~TRINITY_DN517_c0_g2_i2.p1  ORF type:complete len:365 (+),score=166.67 TRINITY_DN517_c0_g2_i2:92-1186(+)